jgi:hypothetical protein
MTLLPHWCPPWILNWALQWALALVLCVGSSALQAVCLHIRKVIQEGTGM